MKDLKEFILERRVREFKVDGKKIPDKYIAVFNDYIVQIAEQIKDHDKELVEKMLEEVEDSFTAYLPLRNRTGAWFYGRLNEIKKEFEDE